MMITPLLICEVHSDSKEKISLMLSLGVFFSELSFATIRCLVLSFTLNMAYMSHITNTAWVVVSLNHIRAPNRLEELVIMVHHDTKQDTTPDTDEWTSDLDRPLDQEGFKALARLSIYVAPPDSGVDVKIRRFPSRTEKNITKHMPMLKTLGVLKVGHLDKWDEVNSVYTDVISRTLRPRRRGWPGMSFPL
jgi:hypothetical protein